MCKIVCMHDPIILLKIETLSWLVNFPENDKVIKFLENSKIFEKF